MAGQRSVYVHDRTFSAIRPGDMLGPRINQIVDRWQEVVRAHGAEVRDIFTDDEWRALLAYSQSQELRKADSMAMFAMPLMLREGGFGDKLRNKLAGLSVMQGMVMIDLLESDTQQKPAKTAAKKRARQ